MPFIETVAKLLTNTKDKILNMGRPPEKEVSYAEITKPKTKDTSEEAIIQTPLIKEEEKIEVLVQKVKVKETQEVEIVVSEETIEEIPRTKKSTTKKSLASKATAKETTLSKKDIKTALYHKDITKHYGEVDTELLTLIVKNLGPSIYRKNAELVSCGEAKELDTVRKNFLIKKLGLEESREILDASIQEVCQELKGVRQKYRATFYYRLAQKFNKASALS